LHDIFRILAFDPFHINANIQIHVALWALTMVVRFGFLVVCYFEDSCLSILSEFALLRRKWENNTS